ncbi:HipA domain-containing protein [Rhodoferax ferrireducens]|uniref:HipA domain-containing protein n=1 Tax=Rhodoferax ferrireducens TaxID=192843 RepID=UPI000E0DABFC|nr:HipA domain-containing protein [Rhodoferax ferrireducens]
MSSDPVEDLDRALDVFCGTNRIGRLAFDPANDQFSFAYDPEWLKHPDRFQLTPHIPFEGETSHVVIRRYIDNLLPEGRALDVVSSFTNIQKTHLFGLIRVLGRETAGALSFLPAGQLPQAQQPERRKVELAELQQRIDERNSVPFTVWDGRVRMSVAGYQDKLLVLREGDDLFLADGSLSSTHILKPEPLNENLPCMVANEHFCMTLVNRLSQRRLKENWAAEVEILRVPAPVLCVARFDRVRVDERVRRRHTIDGCQALNLPVSAKYERSLGNAADVRHIRDGASFQALATLRPNLSNAAVGIRQMAMWAVTTLLLGNSDAHGKNISFFGYGDVFTVAPFYDLVSVAVYDGKRIDHELAMAFGDEFTLPAIKSFALADFCERLGFPRRTFARELKQLCEWAKEEAQLQAADPVYVSEECAFVKQLADYIVSRADFLLGQAAEIPKFKADLF